MFNRLHRIPAYSRRVARRRQETRQQRSSFDRDVAEEASIDNVIETAKSEFEENNGKSKDDVVENPSPDSKLNEMGNDEENTTEVISSPAPIRRLTKT